jgi:hypothetical protein
MTDEELVKMARLAQRDDRMATGALYGDLADRIEALTAKLAKAVDALRLIEADCEADYPPSHLAIKYAARATLAEIEGEKG